MVRPSVMASALTPVRPPTLPLSLLTRAAPQRLLSTAVTSGSSSTMKLLVGVGAAAGVFALGVAGGE